MTSPRRRTPEFLSRLKRLNLSTHRLGGAQEGGSATGHRRGMGQEFVDHRRYVAGDDLRYVDWSVYGRLGEMQVKEFAAEESMHLVLVIDRSASMGVRRDGQPSKLDLALDIGAALGALVLWRGDGVTLLVSDRDRAPERISFRGRSRLMDLIDRLDGVDAGGGDRDMLGLREFFRRGEMRSTRPVTVLLSDLLRPPADFDSLFTLAARHSVRTHVIHLAAPEEVDPPLSGRIELIDSETGEPLVLEVDETVRKTYRDRFQKHLDAIRGAALKRGIAHVLLQTDQPMEEAVLSLLRDGRLFR